ncbi:MULTISPECIES: helix-turn-helix domain-containing protein [Streptomyces]|uniref:helix-turn-helix domain-containing protein n=1 Tax=Streptomyces TaxID=1883 RepID=UPI00167BA9DB|nr:MULTISPECIES: helix-turn-helix domain-containing protein [Streptomyces]MBK3521154.1 helix-turn-helix domain-containing protein [Streptomyces sp. MBT70]
MSTRSVDQADRVDLWEDYQQTLVGLTCSPYSHDGLLATQTNVGLGSLRLADIAGNEHVIERNARPCRETPKDSVFATLLASGQAVFFHGGCLSLGAGDLVLYDTRRSCLLGFPTTMRQLLVDIPREVFAEGCLSAELPAPLVFGRRSAADAPAVRALESVLSGWFAQREPGDAAGTEDTVLGLVRSLATFRVGGGRPGDDQGARLLLAKEYIDRHLSDPRLCVEHVADAVGVSTRQLCRVFRQAGLSPSRHILESRLTRVHEQLADPGSERLTVADIADVWGFASQSHFSRVFRERYGRTPGELRPTSPGRRDRPPRRRAAGRWPPRQDVPSNCATARRAAAVRIRLVGEEEAAWLNSRSRRCRPRWPSGTDRWSAAHDRARGAVRQPALPDRTEGDAR